MPGVGQTSGALPLKSARGASSIALGAGGLLAAMAVLWLQNYMAPVVILILPVAVFLISMVLLKPEYALVLAFSSAIIKEWVSTTIPFFSFFDFTIFLFLVAIVSVLCRSIRTGHFFIFKMDGSFATLLFFTAWMLITTLYTPDSSYGLFKSISFLVFNWGLFLLPIIALDSIMITRRMITIFIVFGVVVSIFTITMMIQGIMGGALIESYRASFLGTNPISFAGWVGIINIMLITMMPTLRSRILKMTGIVCSGILGIALLIANSRGPLFAFVATALIIGAIRFKTVSKSKAFISFVVLFVLFAILLIVLPEQFTNRYFETIGVGKSQNYMAMYTVNSRLLFWKTSLGIATENIRHFLFGIGVGGFNTYFFHIKELTLYPHNIFFEVLCELGLVGAFTLVLYLFQIFYKVVRVLKKDLPDDLRHILLAVFMAAVFQLVAAQFSGDLNDNRRLWFFLGATIAVLNIYSKAKTLHE